MGEASRGERVAAPRFRRRQVLGVGAAVGVVAVAGGVLGLRSCNAPQHFRRGINLAGAEFTPAQLPGIHGQDYFYPTAETLDYYRGKGLTLVRLPCRWERLQRALNAPLDPDELALLDGVIAAAAAREMAVILDIHNYARYGGAVIGTAAVPNAAFADLWRQLATRYRAETTIWAYGLMNEPHDTDGRWPAAAQAAVDAIRTVDGAHRLLVAGDGWSSAMAWRQHNEALRISDPAKNILYEAHQYFDEDGTGAYRATYEQQGAHAEIGAERVRPFAEWLAQHRLDGFIGEYGVPGDDARWLTVLDRFLAYLDSRGIGGTYWAGGRHWGDDYALSVEPRGGVERPQMGVLGRHLSR